jgi:formylglycine-generating enzyme required for sulfatase activity/predicted Ser/Thr protein kinase
MTLTVGDLLNNRYRILKLLGQGGYGEVYQALDLHLDGLCAVKRNIQLSPEVRRQFEKEAHMLFKLHHSGLPKVYDYFEELGQEQYLVMEFIEGEDLKTRLEREGPVAVDQALIWIEQVSEALNYLHTRQPPIIHRDIKPGNIIINLEGRAMLVDFGIAKSGDIQQMTSTGARGVTSGFSPPEQYGPSGTDAQSDVYALAATAYAMFTGQVPEDALAITLGEKPAPQLAHLVNPEVPDGISNVVAAAMRLKRNERTHSVKEFLDRLKVQINAARKPAILKEIKLDVHENEKQLTKYQQQKKPDKINRCKSQKLFACGIAFLLIFIGVGSLVYMWLSWSKENKSLQSDLNNTLDSTTNLPAQVENKSILEMGSTDNSVIETSSASTMQTFSITTETEKEQSGLSSTETATVFLQQQNIEATSKQEYATKPPTCITSGQTWTSPKDGMNLLCVPSGKFIMGSDDGDPDEKPVHSVSLDAYWIDQTEVTNKMFTKFIEETGYQTAAEKGGWGNAFTGGKWERVEKADWRHPFGPQSSIAGLEQHPVVQVSWDDAVAYCQWASRRLPTEAEWEKATRGMDNRVFPWGNEIPNGNLLNFADDNLQVAWAVTTVDDGYRYSAPVGSYPEGTSPFGVLDMAGNVSEWVNDRYSKDYYQVSPDINPLGPGSGNFYVLRGGAWDVIEMQVRASSRDGFAPFSRFNTAGFRCAYSP